MKCITQLLDTVFKQNADWKIYLMAHWPKIIGNLAPYVTLEKVLDETIILGVKDSTWMQELYMLSHVLLNKINQSLEQPHIKHIKLRQSSYKKKYIPHKTRKKQTEYIHKLTFKEKKALEKIHDQELNKALEKFLIKCYQVKKL